MLRATRFCPDLVVYVQKALVIWVFLLSNCRGLKTSLLESCIFRLAICGCLSSCRPTCFVSGRVSGGRLRGRRRKVHPALTFAAHLPLMCLLQSNAIVASSGVREGVTLIDTHTHTPHIYSSNYSWSHFSAYVS